MFLYIIMAVLELTISRDQGDLELAEILLPLPPGLRPGIKGLHHHAQLFSYLLKQDL